MQAKRAKNKEPVTAQALLTKLLQAATNGVPAGLDCMRVKMSALVYSDLALPPAEVDPADGEDTLDLSQLRESRIVPAGQRWSVNLDLYGQVQRSATEQVQWLAHEIYRADLVIKDGRAFGVCDAGTFSIDSVTISAHSDANKITVRNIKFPASVVVQFTTLPPDEMPAVLGLIQKILNARTLRRAQFKLLKKVPSELAPIERAFGLAGNRHPAGSFTPLFPRKKNGWHDISHTNENGKDDRIQIKITDATMRKLTGQKFGNHKQTATMSMGGIQTSADEMAEKMLARVEQLDFQTVKQIRYIFGEAFENGGWAWVTTAGIAAALGISKCGKQWKGIEDRLRDIIEIRFDCTIVGQNRKKAEGTDRLIPLLAFIEWREDEGWLFQIPPTLLEHCRAGYGSWMDSRALLLGTKTLHELIATRMYWSAARYLSLNRRRGVHEWTRKVSECMGDQLGITARTVAALRHHQKAGRDAVLDVLRKACTLLVAFKHDGQTIRLVHSARIEGDTIDNATVHVVLLPDTKQVGITNTPALPAGVA